VALALVPPAIGARYEELAHQRWRTVPAAALAELGRAAAWQPLDARPRLAEGIVAIADRRPGLARSAFARAADRDANGWFARLELGLLLAKAGDVPGARTQIARARAINPREPIVRQAESSPSSLDPRATALRILASPG
jgi:Flp pilus assembly protein TadD